MADNVGLVAKVAGFSALGAIAIRYGAPLLPWPSTVPVVLALVLSPSLIMGIILTWRGQQEC